MPKKPKPANSSVIAGYELLKQHIELEDAKRHLAKIDEIQRRRRVPKKGADHKEPDESKTQSKIADMDMHRISFEEFYGRLGVDERIN